MTSRSIALISITSPARACLGLETRSRKDIPGRARPREERRRPRAQSSVRIADDAALTDMLEAATARDGAGGARRGDAASESAPRARCCSSTTSRPSARGFARILTSRRLHGRRSRTTGARRRALARERAFDAIVSDIAMPGMNGIALLRAVREHDLDVPVILMTGGPAIESAVAGHGVRRAPLPHQAHRGASSSRRWSRAPCACTRWRKIKREALELFRLEGKPLGDRAGLEARFANALATLWVAYQPIVSWSRQAGLRLRGAGAQRGADAARARRDLFEAAERLGPPAGARAHHPRPRRRDAGRRRRPSEPAASSTCTPSSCDDDIAVRRRRRRCRRHAKRVVLEITERAPIEKIRDVDARVAQLRAHGLPHRRRRSRRRLRGAHQLRAPRARGGQGRHVADPRPRPARRRSRSCCVDRRRCAASSASR